MVQVPQGSYIVQVRSESISVTVSEPTTVTIAGLTTPKRVIVTGTGSYQLTQPELWASDAIGRMLAEAGHSLVTGGFQGVDHVTARAFTEAVRSAGQDVTHRLTHFVSAARNANFPEGNVVRMKPGEHEIPEEVRHADAVIVIGGRGGAIRVANAAVSEGLTVLPLPATEGDAAALFERSAAGAREGISPSLAMLSAALRSPADAPAMAARVRHLLATIVDGERPDDGLA